MLKLAYKIAQKIRYFTIVIYNITGGLYFSYLYLLPPVLTSHRMQTKYEQILSNRFNLNISLSGLALKTNPNFYLELIYRVIFRVEKTKATYKAKLAQIPPIKIKPMDIESVSKVSICGNLNEGNVKVQLKDLR